MSVAGSKIYGQITKVMAEIDHIAKGRKNPQQGYAFRGIDDVYNTVHPLLVKHGIFCAPRVIEKSREERQTQKGGTLIYTMLTVQFQFYAEDGSSVEVVTVGEAMDSGDKSSNKAMSAAQKYAFIQLFAIPTEGDNDTENTTHHVVSSSPTKVVTPENRMREGAPATEAQIRRMFAICSQNGMTSDQIRTFAEDTFKKTSSKDLAWHEVDEIIDHSRHLASQGAK